MLDKLSKNLLGLLFQFVQEKDLLRLECISKKVRIGATQDYIWRYLTENTLELAQKFYSDSWKQCYWRNRNAIHHMTPKTFNFNMCPIRHFKSIIKYIDCMGNFVVAADEAGSVGVFLIDERDLENDEDTLKVHSFGVDGVEHMQIIKRNQELMIVTSTLQVLIYQIQQLAQNDFSIELSRKMELPFNNPSNVYLCPLDEIGELFFACNMPLNGDDFMKDQTIVIYNAYSNSLILSQTLEFGDEPSDAVQNFLYQIRPQLYQNPFWMNRIRGFGLPFAQPQQIGQQLTCKYINQERKNFPLAAYNGQKLIFSYHQKNLAVVDTSMTKVEMFLKKGNYWQINAFPEETTGPALALKQIAGLLLTYNYSELNLFDFNTLTLLQKLPIGGHSRFSLMCNTLNQEITLVLNLQQQIQFSKLRVDASGKKLIELETVQKDEQHSINDIDSNRYLFASATTEGNIKLRRLNDLSQDPFFINAGSKSVKTYLSHPTKPGVSMVKAEQSKIIAVLGNVIRVYSFDIQRQKK